MRDYAPDYVVPSILRWFERLPTGVNGKVDVRAIRELLQSESGVTLEHSSDEVTAVVTDCWREVLNQDVIDPDTNFFDCGGSSLRLLPLQQIIERKTGVRLDLAELVQIGTLRQFAAYVKGQSAPAAPAGTRDVESARAAARRRRSIRLEMGG